MSNFFLRNLKNPHQIPGKILSKIEFFISKKKYDQDFYINHQNQIFKKLSLDRYLGKKRKFVAIISLKSDKSSI